MNSDIMLKLMNFAPSTPNYLFNYEQHAVNQFLHTRFKAGIGFEVPKQSLSFPQI